MSSQSSGDDSQDFENRLGPNNIFPSRTVYILLSVFIVVAVIGWFIENFVFPEFRFASLLNTVSNFATLAFLFLTPLTNGNFAQAQQNLQKQQQQQS